MDADAPVNIRTLGETTFNPELSDELNLNFGFHYSATSTLMQHVLREMDGRTLFRLYAMHMGLFGEASLAEMLEEQRRDVCPVCLFGDFEVLSKVLIMPCCGTRYHPDCINPCSKCPTCRCKRPTIGWVGFQTWVSYFTWDDWRGRIDRILQKDPVRAIVPLIRALSGTHSDYLKYDAVIELLKLVPQYSVWIWGADVRGTLVNLIAEDSRLQSGAATKLLFYQLQEAAWLLFSRLCEMHGSLLASIRPMLEGDSSHITVALKILRRVEPTSFAPFADYTVSLLKHRDPRVCEEALSLLKAFSENGMTVEYMPLLVEMLSAVGTDESKQVAARAICTLLIDACDDPRLVIVHAGAIPHLVAMLSALGTDEVKEVAAQALISLSSSYNDETIVAIAQAGAIPPLVTMLSAGGADDVKVTAARALYNLTMTWGHYFHDKNLPLNDDNIETIAQAGAIPPLVMMLSALTDDIKESAAWLLGNLSSNSNYKKVARAGAIPHLVLMLRGDTRRETTSSACMALWRLSTSNDDNKVTIAREGAIPYLVEILSSENHHNAGDAAMVLGELSNNDDIRVDVVRAGVIPPLVAMLSSRSYNVNIKAMNALRNLLSDNNNKEAIARAGAIPHLVEILRKNHQNARDAAMVLGELSTNDSIRAVAVRAGAIPVLAERVNRIYGDEDVREAAAEALRILTGRSS